MRGAGTPLALLRVDPLATQVEDRCVRCMMRPEVCLCPLPRVPNRTPVVIVRHRLEAFRPTNTARLAALALAQAELYEFGRLGVAGTDAPLRVPGTWLLFPDGPPLAPHAPRPARLLVLDGTWPQARRMAHRLEAVRGLPRFALPAPAEASDRLRTEPHREGMATLEAIAHALSVLDGPEVAQPLLALYRRQVAGVLATRRGQAGLRPA